MTRTRSDDYRECPYCGYKTQPEAENYSEQERAETCDDCGKEYIAYDEFTVTHIAVARKDGA